MFLQWAIALYCILRVPEMQNNVQASNESF